MYVACTACARIKLLEVRIRKGGHELVFFNNDKETGRLLIIKLEESGA